MSSVYERRRERKSEIITEINDRVREDEETEFDHIAWLDAERQSIDRDLRWLRDHMTIDGEIHYD